MPDVDPEAVVTATADGITVEKTFEPDDFPVPAIAFAISSGREESVTVRLVDTVPDDIAPENVGFHPKYGAEFWDVAGDEIVFEREFDPDEEYTTVYGLRGGDADVPARFLSEPAIESVDPPLDGGDTADTAAVDAADATEEDGSSPTAVEEAIGNGAEGTDVTVDDDGTATGDGPDRATGVELDAASGRSVDGDLLSALTEEIEAADPDDPAVAELRDALGIDLARATVEARIEHLQSAVADLEAYTDALEAFLDENGDAQQVLDDLRAEYEETTARLDDVESLAEATNESVESLDIRIDAETDDLRSDIERLESDIEAFSDDLSEVVEMRDRLTRALGGLAGGAAVVDHADATDDSDAEVDTDAVGDSDSDPDAEPDDASSSSDDSNDENVDDDAGSVDIPDEVDDDSEGTDDGANDADGEHDDTNDE